MVSDLILIELSEPLIFNDHVSPVVLSLDAKTSKFPNATMAGWGTDISDAAIPLVSARYVNVSIIENGQCIEQLSKTLNMNIGFVSPDHLCYISLGNLPRDSCLVILSYFPGR